MAAEVLVPVRVRDERVGRRRGLLLLRGRGQRAARLVLALLAHLRRRAARHAHLRLRAKSGQHAVQYDRLLRRELDAQLESAHCSSAQLPQPSMTLS